MISSLKKKPLPSLPGSGLEFVYFRSKLFHGQASNAEADYNVDNYCFCVDHHTPGVIKSLIFLHVNFSWRFCQSKLMGMRCLLENFPINGKHMKRDAYVPEEGANAMGHLQEYPLKIRNARERTEFFSPIDYYSRLLHPGYLHL